MFTAAYAMRDEMPWQVPHWTDFFFQGVMALPLSHLRRQLENSAERIHRARAIRRRARLSRPRDADRFDFNFAERTNQEPLIMVSLIDMPQVASKPEINDRMTEPEPTVAARGIIEIEDLDFAYGANHVLHDVTLNIPPRAVTAFIGPSGCGKTTLLRCLNRMNDLIDSSRILRGTIRIEGADINEPGVDVVELRRRVGMVFQNRIRSRNRFTTTSPMACALLG